MNSHKINNQDWTQVVFKKNTQQKLEKQKIKHNPINDKINKLDNDNEIYKTKKIPNDFKTKMQQARINKKLTQKQLATKLNISLNIIQNFENGKANYDGSIIGKIKRELQFK